MVMADTDKKLLDEAALAAGPEFVNLLSHGKWNPLTDDAHALRLAVKLRMTIHRHDPAAVCAGWGVGTHGAPTLDGMGPWFWKEWLRDNPDEAAATRRAIVRAAASLTKESPQ